VTGTATGTDEVVEGLRIEGSAAPRPEVPDTHALEVDLVEKRFGKVTAVGGVSLTAAPGEFVTLLGPSGCGKTTLLRMIAGIEAPTGGRITIGGTVVSDPSSKIQVPPERRRLGMVFQSYAIWPHMTVGKNVAYPLKRAGVDRDQRRVRVLEALESVGLAHLIDRYPGEMSGGQQQRVALARAIVGRPRLLLLDEPLSNLDARLRENMRIELKRLQLELGLTTLYVTHDQSEALAMSDKILVMDAGLVRQVADPETLYRRPADLTVARFLGVKNVLAGVVVAPGVVDVVGQQLTGVHFNEALAVGDKVDVTIRPDAVLAAGDETVDVLRGTVDVAEFLGTGYEHQLTLSGDTTLVAHTTERLGVRGESVTVTIKPGGAVAYPFEPGADTDGD
jgi:iron(III) transport system ATP-binding protein